jgi:HEAT repeat protein
MRGGVRAEVWALRDSDATARKNAATALGNVRVDEAPEALAALGGALDDPEPHVRELAVQSIGRIAETIAADPRARAEFFAPTSQEGYWTRAGDAASDPFRAAAAGVLAAFDDPEPAVRLAATQVLSTLGRRTGAQTPPRLVAALDDPSPDVQTAAVAAAGSFPGGSDLAIPAYFRWVERDEGGRGSHGAGVFGLSPSRAAVPVLVARLKGSDARSRVAAASLLGNLGADASEAIPSLLAAFESSPVSEAATSPVFLHPVDDLATVASQALARIAPGTPSCGEVVAALAAALHSERASMRAAAASALERMGDDAKAAVPALASAMKAAAAKEEPSYDGWVIAEALGRVAPGCDDAPAAVAALIEALRAGPQMIRIRAAEALAQFGPKAAPAIPDLRRLQADADPFIQEAVERTLSVVETPPRATTGPG